MNEVSTDRRDDSGSDPKSDPLYVLDEVARIYRRGGVTVDALKGVSLTIDRGCMVAVEGPSGSGKSTLLQLLGVLDVPTSGRITLDGITLESARDNVLTGIRAREIGFVFQQFNLIPTLTAAENIKVAMVGRGVNKSARDQRARALLERVGLADRADHLPSRLSGGEQQRVAIARALVNEPRVVLADEPTGNLDSETAQDIMRVLRGLVDDDGVTVVVVTHDDEVAQHADRRIRLRDGKLVGTPAA